jgi:hypothetical protein
MLRIVGKWYRCAFCAKDLCADCERLDTHDYTHAFLVFKAPVDMQAFRYVIPLPHTTYMAPLIVVMLSTDILLIWKVQMAVHLCYEDPSTAHDMT